MTWDNDRAWLRVDDLDVPHKLHEWCTTKWGMSSVSLMVERVGTGKTETPTAGHYSIEKDDTPAELAKVLAGYALAAHRDYSERGATGRIRVRTTGKGRSSCDFRIEDVGRRHEGLIDSDHGAGQGQDCPGCRAYELIMAQLRDDNTQLREMHATSSTTLVDRVLDLVDKNASRTDTLLDGHNDRLEHERGKRDELVGELLGMAKEVLSPSNDATARTLGILDKGVELTGTALEALRRTSEQSADERKANQRKELADKLIDTAGNIALPLIAKKLGIDPGELLNMSTPTKPDDTTPIGRLGIFRDAIFEETSDEHWSDVRDVLGDDLTDRLLSIKDGDPDPVKIFAVIEDVRGAGVTKMLALGQALPQNVVQFLLALPEVAQEAIDEQRNTQATG